MTPEYKAAKEASVSFLGGGGIWEINHVTLVAPAAALLWAILQTRQSFFKPYTIPAFVTDFLLQCGAILFATTVYSSGPQILNGLLILPAIATLLQPAKGPDGNTRPPTTTTTTTVTNGKPKGDDDQPTPDLQELDRMPVKPFITTYRGAMMIVTCISILAVDFKVFPRRFAKTESFGTSLMDVGVGSFVFAAGIVAARQQLKERYAQSSSFVKRFRTAMRHSLPLFALGFIRLWSVKGLDYAEHVSEYGVHWNFFFTLALLSPVIAVIQPVLRLIPSPSYCLLAFAIVCCYETALWYTRDLKVWLILGARVQGDWLSQNREGVFSFIGYFAIFLAGMGVGMDILVRDPEPESDRPAVQDPLDEDEEWLAEVLGGEAAPTKKPISSQPDPMGKPELPKTVLGRLAFWTAAWFVCCVWAMWHYGPQLYVSRRLANLAYVVWVCAFNSGQLLLFCTVETVVFPNLYKAKDRLTERQRIQDATSKVMQAFNRNGLAVFLLANLFTGAINMTMPTLHMGDVEAMVVLVAYIATLCGVAVALDHYDVSIKL